jgi:hypothetical protein
VTNLLSTLLFLGVIGALAWVGWGLEPHWASKDGAKFMCRMAEATSDVQERPRWRDVKISVVEDELLVYARSRRTAHLRGVWKIIGASNDDAKKRRFYELRSTSDSAAIIRVPQSSRCIAVLDALVP